MLSVIKRDIADAERARSNISVHGTEVPGSPAHDETMQVTIAIYDRKGITFCVHLSCMYNAPA